MVLSDVKKGDIFIIINIKLDSKTKARLQDMGFTKGVKAKMIAFYLNNAYIINVRGSRIVIDKDIADRIKVEKSYFNNCSRKFLGRVNKIS